MTVMNCCRCCNLCAVTIWQRVYMDTWRLPRHAPRYSETSMYRRLQHRRSRGAAFATQPHTPCSCVHDTAVCARPPLD
jgi:hypothetical protein